MLLSRNSQVQSAQAAKNRHLAGLLFSITQYILALSKAQAAIHANLIAMKSLRAKREQSRTPPLFTFVRRSTLCGSTNGHHSRTYRTYPTPLQNMADSRSREGSAEIEAIEAAKENVLPLRQGRSASKLTGLLSKDRKSVENELKLGHERFQAEIEQVEADMDNNDDPLDVYNR